MPKRSSTLPGDPNQLAALVVALSTGQTVPEERTAAIKPKNPAAVALGKLGGAKGGKARAEKLTAEERREIAIRAAKMRWLKQG